MFLVHEKSQAYGYDVFFFIILCSRLIISLFKASADETSYHKTVCRYEHHVLFNIIYIYNLVNVFL